MVAPLLNNVTRAVTIAPDALALTGLTNITNNLKTATKDMESVVRTMLLASNESVTELIAKVDGAVGKLEMLGASHLLLRYLGLGATLSGVTLIFLSEVLRDNPKWRSLASISGMGLTAFGVSQLFEIRT